MNIAWSEKLIRLKNLFSRRWVYVGRLLEQETRNMNYDFYHNNRIKPVENSPL